MEKDESGVELVPFELDEGELEIYLGWLRDYEVIKYLNKPDYIFPVLRDIVNQYMEDLIKRKECRMFKIMCGGIFIGTFKIDNINFITRSCDMGIMVGNKSYWGKGIGKAAYKIAINFCFNKLKLRKITAGCMGKNIGIIKVLENLGFKKEGEFKEQDFIEGEFVDHLYYGLFYKDYIYK